MKNVGFRRTKMKSFIINANDANQRVDKFIIKAVPLLPPALLYKYLRLKRIKRNKKRCNASDRLNAGDLLELYINDEFFQAENDLYFFLHAPATLRILYEDENILLINKPVGLVVHEDNTHTGDTLINRVLHYLYNKKEYLPEKENSFIPSLCNRIDRNTSGIVIAAKNATALRIMNEKIKNREIEKYYLCIVHGKLEKKQATLSHYLRKDCASNTVTVLPQKQKDTKTIITQYKVLKELPNYSLLEVKLLTGRTHQIRAHFAYIGHPLVGDAKYGRNKTNKNTGYRYQALCSYKLTFAFQTDASILNYLNGKSFSIDQPDILSHFDTLV